MSYIGRGVDAISNVEKLDNITFDGSATYALTKSSAAFTPVGANNILVSIDGVIQQGNFSVSTTNIVFDWSPTSSNTCNFILHYGTGVLNVPADGSISAAKMAANSVDSDSYVDGSIDAVHLSANSVDSDAYVDGSIDLAHMSSESVDEDNLQISNAGSNGNFLQKQSGNTGGLTWASASSDADNYFASSGLSSKDLGDGLHIKTADSGAAAESDADHLVIEGSGGAGMSILTGTSSEGKINFGDSGNDNQGQILYHHNGDTMRFNTDNNERMRITSTGAVGIDSTTPDAKLDVRQAANDAIVGLFKSYGASFAEVVAKFWATRNSTNGTYTILQCNNGGGTVMDCIDSGNVRNTNNSYGALSDERIKQDIEDASSQWEDIKALKVRKFKLKKAVNKDGVDDTPYHLGVIAQEVEDAGMSKLIEESKPEKEQVALSSDFGTLVTGTADNGAEAIKDDDGNITGYEDVFTAGQKVKAVKYSILYMKAIKALQESMERIEQLEAKVTALENA